MNDEDGWMRLVVLLLLLIVSNPAWADPGWLHPDLTKEECDGESWKTRGGCYQEFYKQQSSRYEDFILFELGLVDQDGCEGVTKAYLEREAAWARYKSAECALQMHCVGPCGSGESSGWHSCHGSVGSQRHERLQGTIKNGLAIWGCRFRPNEGARRFQTEQFDIVIEANCPTGRIGCDKIKYVGTDRETKESLELIGKELLVTEPDGVSFKGYVFKDDDITYKLLTSGRLIVEDEKDGRALLEQAGTWTIR